MREGGALPRALIAATLAGSAACATVRHGHVVVDRDWDDEDSVTIRTKGAVKLHCPKDQIALVTISAETVDLAGGKRATEVHVEGCGSAAVYVRRSGGDWTPDVK